MRRASIGGDMQRELVERAIAGDKGAFSSLVEASASQQYAIASLILRDRDRAQDAVQDALILAWRNIAALRVPDAWDAWLRRLTVRACFATSRRERRRGRVELHVMLAPEPAAPGDAIAALAERDRLARALDHLAIEQRAVVVLVYYVGLSLSDAAISLDIPVGTAKSRLHRGLATLRRAIDRPAPAVDALSVERAS
jgi:RNA polymerase sigma-70 factor (ECF subfamily)